MSKVEIKTEQQSFVEVTNRHGAPMLSLQRVPAGWVVRKDDGILSSEDWMEVAKAVRAVELSREADADEEALADEASDAAHRDPARPDTWG